MKKYLWILAAAFLLQACSKDEEEGPYVPWRPGADKEATLDLDKGHDVEYRMHTPGNGAYVFVIEGLAEVDGEVLGRRDGMGVWDTDGFGIRASADAQVLVIEVPMR